MRQFVLETMLDATGTVAITGKDFRYLAQVLRLRPKDTLDVRLPDGSLLPMQVSAREANRMLLSKLAEGQTQTKGAWKGGVQANDMDAPSSCTKEGNPVGFGCELWLLQCMTKPQKMDTIIRQATEIGVSCIIPLMGQHAFINQENPSSRLDRWERISREARQQCGSAVSTRVLAPQGLDAAILRLTEYITACGYLQNDWRGFCLSESVEAVPQEAITKSLHEQLAGGPKIVALAVGCEGGFSPSEVDTFVHKGFNKLHFSTNILRAQTAALYGLAAVQILMTEYFQWHASE